MTTFALIASAILFMIGIRLLTIAFRAAVKSEVLVRDKIRYKWQAVDPHEAWGRAFRDGTMGVLVIVLGIFMLY